MHWALEGEMVEQSFPQVPQLLLSVCVLTHPPLHSASPLGQFEIAQMGAVPIHVPLDWQMRVALPERA
jgi:hypothetical protein